MGFLDKRNDLERERNSLFDETPTGRVPNTLDDASNTYANLNQLFIEFYHLPSDRSVAFKGYITGWNDKFESSYNSEQIYGRNDDIHTFEGTTRSISVSWDVVAGSGKEARNNLARISMLAQFLYPAYKMQTLNFANASGTNQALQLGTMTKAPLIKVRFANLIVDSKGNINTVNAKETGLLAAMDGLNIEADLDAGVFDGSGVATPKVFKLSTNLKVLHQHALGWDNDSKLWLGNTENASGYPYNAFGPNKYSGHSKTPNPDAKKQAEAAAAPAAAGDSPPAAPGATDATSTGRSGETAPVDANEELKKDLQAAARETFRNIFMPGRRK